jgi:hypothetical protein
VYVAQRLVGASHSSQEFIDQFRADPSELYLIARVSSAVLGVLGVVASGMLGAVVGGRRVGLIAAGLTAISYLLVRDAHFGVNDALVTLLVTLGLISCVRIAQGGSRRAYLAAGVLAGLAFSAKYYGVALLVPLAAAHFVRTQSTRKSTDLAVSVVACVVAAVVTFPSLITEPGRVINDVYVHLYLDAIGGYDGLDPSGGYVFYARTLIIGLGWPLALTAVIGLVLSVVRRHRAGLIVAALPVALLATLGAERLYFARFALPALPALIVEASLALDALVSLQPALGVAVGLVVGLPPLVDTLRFDVLLTRTDTRSLASEWLAANLAAGATIAVDSPPLGPRLSPGRQALVANEFSLFDLTPADYRRRGIDYVVVSSFTSEARAIDAAREARRQAFNASLPHEASVVAQFRPYTDDRPPEFMYDQIYGPFNALDQLERPGPTVTVYRL